MKGAVLEADIIRFDHPPTVPEGFELVFGSETYVKPLEWNPERLGLYSINEGRDGTHFMDGDQMLEILQGIPVASAHVFDFLMGRTDRGYPKEWEGKYVFFWGSRFKRIGGRVEGVRFIACTAGVMRPGIRFLSDLWYNHSPAAVFRF